MTSYPPRFQADQEFDRFRLRPIRNEEDSPFAEPSEEPTFHPHNYEEHPVRRINLQQNEDDIRNLGFFKRTDIKGETAEDEAEWQERQSPINFILIAGILFVCTAIGWFGYRWYTSNTQGHPPIIQPEAGPFKVRPENPGGMVIPHQDKLIYGRIAPEQYQPVERLLPPPEQPVIPAGQEQGYYNQPYQQGAVYPQGYHDPQGYAPQPPYPSQGQDAPYAQGYPEQGYAHGPYQNPQPYVQQAPNGYPEHAAPQGYAPQPYAPPPPMNSYGQAAPQYQNQGPSPMPIQGGEQGLPSQPVMALPAQTVPSTAAPAEEGDFDKSGLDALLAETPEPAPTLAKKPQDKTAEKAQEKGPEKAQEKAQEKSSTKSAAKEDSTQAGPSLATKGPYMVQVATFSDKTVARKEIDRLIRLEPNLFKDKKFGIQRMELGQNKNPVYRVIIGSFATSNQAAQFRGRLKAHNVKGIVIKTPSQPS